MSSQPIDHRSTRWSPSLERLHCRLDVLAEAPLMSMTPQQKRDGLVRISQDEAQLAALRLRLLAEAEASEATVDIRCRDGGGLGGDRDPAGAPRRPLAT